VGSRPRRMPYLRRRVARQSVAVTLSVASQRVITPMLIDDGFDATGMGYAAKDAEAGVRDFSASTRPIHEGWAYAVHNDAPDA
jgi:hypothetical protein